MIKGEFEYRGRTIKYKTKIEPYYDSLKLVCISKLGEFRLIPYKILIDHNYIPFFDKDTMKSYRTNKEFVKYWISILELHIEQRIVIQTKLESEIDNKIKYKETNKEYHNKIKQFNK